jgi:uncharacterized membrane protein
MKRLLAWFLRGVTVILPPVLTLYILWWLGSTAEAVLGSALRLVLPDAWYRAGMGLIAGVALVVLIGMLTRQWLVARILEGLEGLVERTPVVKTIYGSLKDVMAFFGKGDGERRMQTVVTVTIGEARLLGFVTRESMRDVLGEDEADTIAVYLPMSYQLGGFMVLVPRASITPLALDVETGLRLALTAGVRKRTS